MSSTLTPHAAYQQCGLTYHPNPMQEVMYGAVTGGDCAILLKAPTGTGKMEAVVVPALINERRLVMIYPARSLIEDQEGRISEILQRLSRTSRRPYALVVDTGATMYRRIWVHGQEEHPERRHLYHGDVILTTLDKFLYRFFGFGEPKKSYIYPLRLRYGRQPLFCFDEAHSYDDIAYSNFVDLIRSIAYNADAPRDVVVMTATMPKAYEETDLKSLLAVLDYTQGAGQEILARYYAQDTARAHPTKAFTHLSSWSRQHSQPEALQQHILSLVDDYHRSGQRTIVTVETVQQAIALYRAFKGDKYPDVLLYHGRQTDTVRHHVYARVQELEKADQGYLLITTSAIEVGCDLNAHLLITQLCNPEQLVQRAGRCNRRANLEHARIIVVGDYLLPYTSTLATPQEGEHYLSLLQQMSRRGLFDPAELIALHRKHPVSDYRVQTMFTMLYEYVYQAERANKPLHDKGLVVTRSWAPTITLSTGDGHEHELQISMLRCIAKDASDLNTQCRVLAQTYDELNEQHRWESPRYGGCAYHQEMMIQVPPSWLDDDPMIGYEHLPKVFLSGRHQGYRRWLSYPLTTVQAISKEQPSNESATESQASSDSEIKATRSIWWWYLEQLPPGDELPEIQEFNRDTVEDHVPESLQEESSDA